MFLETSCNFKQNGLSEIFCTWRYGYFFSKMKKNRVFYFLFAFMKALEASKRAEIDFFG